ncbi:MAG TPA: glycosyltransferase family 4 protein [Verrucomicrobiae bacterium]|nr:glycosyltransferase family 4 protein [Verrucomicrobiae bacterium]
MKVLFVHERFGAFAGAESNILASAGALKLRGHTVGILHGPFTGKGLPAWSEAFPWRFPLASDGGSAAALNTFQPDVIYVHKLADLEVIEILLDSGAPLVRMVHDHDLYCMRSYKYNFFTRQICERPATPACLFPCGAFVTRGSEGMFPVQWASYSSKLKEISLNKKFHRLVVATQFMKEELLRNGFAPEKIEIHPPVPPGDSSPPGSFSERNLIIYAGQITRGKGVDVLIKSLALVRDPFECFIFGEGNHRAACEKLSRKLGLAGRVHFKGYVPPKQLEVFYRECSVAVVSSVWPEPFGAVGLEAMRHGLPVVAFDAGGIKEWLIDGHNGFLVPWMDHAAFAARVGQLLRDKPLARAMGECGRRSAAEQFEFSKYIDSLEDLFVRVSAKPRAQPAIA